MRAQRTLAGAAAVAFVLAGPIHAAAAAAASTGEEARTLAQNVERLAQRDGKPTFGPGGDPDPGGLPGYRPNMPSAPAARPVMPEPQNAPMSRGTAPTDSDRSGSSKANEDRKKTEPK